MVEFIVSILRSNVIADFGKWYRVAGSASLGPMGNIGDHEYLDRVTGFGLDLCACLRRAYSSLTTCTTVQYNSLLNRVVILSKISNGIIVTRKRSI